MAKKVKSVEVRASTRWAGRNRWLLHAAGAIAVGATLVGSVVQGRRYAEAHVLAGGPTPTVVFRDVPAWMNSELLDRLTQTVTPVSARSSLDHELLVETAQILAADPWVRRVVQVRRRSERASGDTIEVACEFRTPVALVEGEGTYWMVDADGVKLPERFGRDELSRVALAGPGALKLRVVTGVESVPPQAGEVWPGEDLRAGLDLVRLLHDKPYAADVATVDVRNFGTRLSRTAPQVVMHTLDGVELRWGRPVNASDFFVEASVPTKLATLQKVFHYRTGVGASADGRRRAAYPWYDLRFDEPVVPKDRSGQEQATLTTD